MAISTDSVDPEILQEPRRWDIRFIRNFMIVFGIVSSIFDFLTFGALIFIPKATPEEFRTGWFVESVMTEVLIIVVMRTWKPFYKSMPSRPLLLAMILVLLVALALPYSPLKGILGLTPPANFVAYAPWIDHRTLRRSFRTHEEDFSRPRLPGNDSR
jgi:P-type Mg2+ transporter